MSSDSIAIEVSDGASQAATGESPTATAKESSASRAWRWLDGRLEDLSDYLNPILVKETRQALKSRQFVLWFLLLLVACWIVTIGGIAWIGPSVHYAASGGMLFLAYYLILSLALIIVVPFAAFRSLAAEQEENTRDVLMVSALTPYQIINGKLGSAALQMLVYLSALSPCLAFTYLLRGIDLITILFLPAVAVLASLGLSMVALLLASVTRKRYSQVMGSVGLVALLFAAFWGCFRYLGFAILVEGATFLQSTQFWIDLGAVLTTYACLFLLAYFAAAAMNSFTSANRSTALRRTLFLCQVCFVGWVAGIWIVEEFDKSVILLAGIMAGCFWYVAGSMLTGEEAILSERVRRGLPGSALGRLFGTLFNPGPGAGFLFVFANLLAMLVLLITGLALSEIGSRQFQTGVVFLALGLAYVVGYLGLGRLVIAGLRKFAFLSLLGCLLIDFLLVLSGIGLPELLRASVTRYGRAPFSWFDLSNPVRTLETVLDGALSTVESATVLIVVPGISLCILLLNLTLAAREISQTRAPLPQRVIEDDADLRPPEEAIANPWGDIRQK